ncbi:MAG: exodeoxyribonuclease VII large subunit [Paludibacter sp.]|nr:exodeoxyribonuclease VII large subunit [Paludibacter sp.]
MNSISLSELTTRVQETIKLNFDTPVWIRAEISELRENANGHCYLEFVEKDSGTDYLLAKVKATIWSTTYRMLKPYFESSTGETLRAGLNILVAVTVEYHGVYGFSLNVRDIDPTFTIGELAARRLKIIRQLEADGVVDMNKKLPFPERPQRIAVISSPTAAGYGDFMDQLTNNTHGFAFYTKLFPAIMQGDQAEHSIISALDNVFSHIELFDLVVIIRGGGATTDLACFDSYDLALNCAQFPLPVIAGIGHQRDSSILDMVAHISVKTPTAAAELILSAMESTFSNVLDLSYNISQILKNRLTTEHRSLDDTKWKLKQSLQNKVSAKAIARERLRNRLLSAIRQRIAFEQNRLSILDKSIEAHSPAFLLKHGYTITTVNGKRITSIKDVKPGDKIHTFVHDGEITSKVIEKNQ